MSNEIKPQIMTSGVNLQVGDEIESTNAKVHRLKIDNKTMTISEARQLEVMYHKYCSDAEGNLPDLLGYVLIPSGRERKRLYISIFNGNLIAIDCCTYIKGREPEYVEEAEKTYEEKMKYFTAFYEEVSDIASCIAELKKLVNSQKKGYEEYRDDFYDSRNHCSGGKAKSFAAWFSSKFAFVRDFDNGRHTDNEPYIYPDRRMSYYLTKKEYSNTIVLTNGWMYIFDKLMEIAAKIYEFENTDRTFRNFEAALSLLALDDKEITRARNKAVAERHNWEKCMNAPQIMLGGR